MKKIKMTIKLKSDTLSGSGQGFGAVIDSDIQYDDCGIPYISSKRIHGALRNSLNDILEMPAVSLIKKIVKEKEKEIILNSLFGQKGTANSSSFALSNLVVEDYESVKKWFAYLKTKYPDIFSNETILATFTNIRRQTKIDNDGIAEDHSLRTSRVVNKDWEFHADITFENDENNKIELFALACANLKRIGTKRNRGLGEVNCSLEGDLIPLAISNLKKELEGK